MVLSHRHYQPFSRHILPCFATRTIVPMYFATKSLKKIEKSSFREAILFLQFSTYPFSVFEKNILKSFFSVFECVLPQNTHTNHSSIQIVNLFKSCVFNLICMKWPRFLLWDIWVQDYFPVSIELWRCFVYWVIFPQPHSTLMLWQRIQCHVSMITYYIHSLIHPATKVLSHV